MWLQAKTTIRVATPGGRVRTVESTDAPVEVDDDTGAELLDLDAAEEVPAPAVPPVRSAKTKAR